MPDTRTPAPDPTSPTMPAKPTGRDNPAEKQPEPSPQTGERQPQKMPQTEPQVPYKDDDSGGGD